MADVPRTIAARLRRSWPAALIVILLLVLATLTVAYDASHGAFERRVRVDGDNMALTYPDGSVVTTTPEHDYRGRRGEVVVFKNPDATGRAERLVGRIVGTGGESVSCSEEGHILVDGEVIDASGVPLADVACAVVSRCQGGPVVVPDRQLLVMGDDSLLGPADSFQGRSSESQKVLADTTRATCLGDLVPVASVVGIVSSEGGIIGVPWATIVWVVSWLWFVWSLLRFRRSMARGGEAASFESATARAVEDAPEWVRRERQRIVLGMSWSHRLQQIQWWTTCGQVAWWLAWPIWWPVTPQALWPAVIYSWAFYAAWNWYQVWFWSRRIPVRRLDHRSQWLALISSGLVIWLLLSWPSSPIIWPLVGMLVLDCGVWGAASEWIRTHLMSPFAAFSIGRSETPTGVNDDLGRPNLTGHHALRCSALSRHAGRDTVRLAFYAGLATHRPPAEVQGAFKLRAVELADAAGIDLADVWDKDPALMSRREADTALTFAIGAMWASR